MHFTRGITMTTTASSVGSASPELHTHQCFRNLFASFVGTRNKDIGHKPQPLSGAGLALVFFLAVLALANATPAAAQSTTADVVYGQFGSFTTNTGNNGGVSANSLGDPTGVALDSSGNLYVADWGNGRVLLYPPTTTPGIYGPVNHSTLTGNSVTFWWVGYSDATAYWVDIGSTMGGNNYYSSGNLGNVYNTTVYTLPTNGTTIYVTLYSLIGSEWIGNPYTYTALNATSGLAVMTTPNPLSGTTVTFNWSADTNATAYWVDISAVAAGGNDLDSSGNLGNVLTETVYNMPANSTPIYVSLYSYVGGQWLNKPYTYVSGP
jgi:hypothetical protein